MSEALASRRGFSSTLPQHWLPCRLALSKAPHHGLGALIQPLQLARSRGIVPPRAGRRKSSMEVPAREQVLTKLNTLLRKSATSSDIWSKAQEAISMHPELGPKIKDLIELKR